MSCIVVWVISDSKHSSSHVKLCLNIKNIKLTQLIDMIDKKLHHNCCRIYYWLRYNVGCHNIIWSPLKTILDHTFNQTFFKYCSCLWHTLTHSYCDLRVFKMTRSLSRSACHWPVRTMINDRNIWPRWSNVNHHPHSARGAGNPYMATLWQWRMLRPPHACLASTSHLSYLSELLFQSIQQADIWMVFNILVGMAWNRRKKVWI